MKKTLIALFSLFSMFLTGGHACAQNINQVDKVSFTATSSTSSSGGTTSVLNISVLGSTNFSGLTYVRIFGRENGIWHEFTQNRQFAFGYDSLLRSYYGGAAVNQFTAKASMSPIRAITEFKVQIENMGPNYGFIHVMGPYPYTAVNNKFTKVGS